MRTRGGGGGSERTHLPAIIFALRIIIASPSSGVSVMGPAHPMTREITDLLRTALNEQLDWRLDDLDLRMVGHALREFGLDR